MNDLTDAMIAANDKGMAEFPKAAFSVRQILSEGNYVAVHTQLLNNSASPSEGGLRQVHLFRFEGDKIVEYWDFTQQVLSTMPNTAGAF